MSDELQKIAWASTSGGASGGQAREPVLWEDGLLLRILGHDGITAFDFPTLDLLGDLDGAASIGADDSGFSVIGGSTVQALLASIDAALGGVLTSVILADGSVPFTGSQSMGDQNLTDVGSLFFSDDKELTADAYSLIVDSDLVVFGNDGWDGAGDKARYAVGGGAGENLAGMLVEHHYGLVLSVFKYGATGAKMGAGSLDVLKISEAGTVAGHAGGETGILVEPEPGIALKVGGDVRVEGDVFTGASGWIDYSGDTVLTGIDTPNNKYLHYRRVGKLLFCKFYFSGEVNSGTEVSFTLPIGTAVFMRDNGAPNILGNCIIQNDGLVRAQGSIVANLATSGKISLGTTWDPASFASWTGTGLRMAFGCFTIVAD